jgi:carboxypeptidase family protein
MLPQSSHRRAFAQMTPGTAPWLGLRRKDAGRWALGLLVACAFLLVAAPVAGASFGTGSISGTVTEATGLKHDLAEIRVTAYEAGNEFGPVGFATTEALGKYKLAGLAPGSYKVKFSLPFQSKLNFVPQYWNDEPSFAAATPVEILTEGEPKIGIDAELHEGGTISGKVTNPTAEGLNEAEVLALSAMGEETLARGVTNSNGEYSLPGLATGNYKVEVRPAFGADFVPQFYADEPSYADATLVPVKVEEETSKVNLTLQVGGEISGRVTDAVTHNPVAGVFVFANDLSGFELGFPFAETNGNGEYTVPGLATGVYDVEFESEGPTVYIPLTDNGIGVAQGSTTSGVNVALTPAAPNNTGAPSASGTAAVGQTLSCSNGSWSGVTPIKFTYQWLRDGGSIGGSTGSTYVVQSGDQGHGLSCEVTATNTNGHASAKSNTLNVPAPPPPPPPPTPTITISSSTLVVFRGSARVRISCTAAPCGGAIELTQQIIVRHRKGRRTISRKETLILGKGVFSLAPGQSGTFVVHLTKTGKNRLARARHHRVSAVLVGTVSGGRTARQAVEVSQAVGRRK